MGTHTVAEARDRLPELIERAREGEAVVITQDGTPVAELKPIEKQLRRVTPADVDWVKAHRAPRWAQTLDSTTLVREMRDETDS
jgi:prevent-host-death family protein